MVNQGLASELINASEVSISDGTDTYLQLQDLVVNLGHPETREETVDAVHYFYGKGDHFIEGTILASSPEISTFVGFTEINSEGAPASNDWVIVWTDVSNNTATATLTGTMAPQVRIEKQITGGVKFRFRIRITEAVTAADIG